MGSAPNAPHALPYAITKWKVVEWKFTFLLSTSPGAHCCCMMHDAAPDAARLLPPLPQRAGLPGCAAGDHLVALGAGADVCVWEYARGGEYVWKYVWEV